MIAGSGVVPGPLLSRGLDVRMAAERYDCMLWPAVVVEASIARPKASVLPEHASSACHSDVFISFPLIGSPTNDPQADSLLVVIVAHELE